MTNSVPVIAVARSDARKATSSATSPGLLGRPRGMPPSMSISFLPGYTVVAFVFFRHSFNHAGGGIGFYETGGNRNHPNSLGLTSFDKALL